MYLRNTKAHIKAKTIPRITDMASSLNIIFTIDALPPEITKEIKMETAVISVISLTIDSSSKRVFVFFHMLIFSTRWLIVIVVVPLPMMPRNTPLINDKSKNITVTAETIAMVLSITSMVKKKAVGVFFRVFDIFRLKPLSKSTTTSANEMRNDALSRKNLPETTLNTGPSRIPIIIRKIDSGILVLLNRRLPRNPTSIIMPKMRMLFAIYEKIFRMNDLNTYRKLFLNY